MLFEEWLAKEIKPVNKALKETLPLMPAPVRPVAEHILGAGGKRMRPLLTVLCARLFGYGKQDIYRLAASMEMLHAATLLHDDVLDNADARRGKPAAHTIFGVAKTILAGDALLACGNAIVAAYDKPALTRCYSLATSQTASGEILEMDSLGRPGLSQEQYLEIARGKTACLISQACAIGALAADAPERGIDACARYGENLGIAFQIVDDALDFAPESQTGKPRGGDLREGKMTPPLRMYRESLADSERAAFDEDFARGGFSPDRFAAIADAVAGFAPAAMELARDCVQSARAALAELPPGDENEILRQMAEYVLARSK